MFAHTGREDGQQIILVSLMLPILLVFVGLVIDVGNLYFHRRTAQNAADAAAVAGSIQLSIDATASATALAYAANNGYSNSGSNTVTVVIKNGCVTVQINEQVRPLLVSLIWNGAFAVSAEAVACMIEAAPATVLLLAAPDHPKENDVLYIENSSKLEITHGTVHANSMGDAVIKMNGRASRLVTKMAATISGTGYTSESDKNFDPAAPMTNQKVQPDPLKDLPVPPCSRPNPPKLEVSKKQSVDPGCYEKIVIEEGATVSFGTGIYYVETDLEVNKNARVTGNGVMFYMEEGDVKIEGKEFNVTPMTSGNYEGIIFFSARSSDKKYTFDGDFGGIEGVIYAANSEIEIKKSGKTEMNASLIVRKLNLAEDGVNLIINGYESAKWSTRDYRLVK